MKTTITEECMNVVTAMNSLHERGVEVEYELAMTRQQNAKLKRMVVNLMKMVGGETVHEKDVRELREYAEVLEKERHNARAGKGVSLGTD